MDLDRGTGEGQLYGYLERGVRASVLGATSAALALCLIAAGSFLVERFGVAPGLIPAYIGMALLFLLCFLVVLQAGRVARTATEQLLTWPGTNSLPFLLRLSRIQQIALNTVPVPGPYGPMWSPLVFNEPRRVAVWRSSQHMAKLITENMAVSDFLSDELRKLLRDLYASPSKDSRLDTAAKLAMLILAREAARTGSPDPFLERTSRRRPWRSYKKWFVEFAKKITSPSAPLESISLETIRSVSGGSHLRDSEGAC